eukprot:359589-Chlamydomonas_euryale.AAC.4
MYACSLALLLRPSRNAVRALKESVANVGHKTGLPPRLLDLFSARPRLEPGTDLRTKKPKQPLSGIASYVDKFAAPGDDEYEPAPPSNRPPSPRLVRNPELRIQARIDTETKEEKSIRMSTWKKEEDMHGDTLHGGEASWLCSEIWRKEDALHGGMPCVGG